MLIENWTHVNRSLEQVELLDLRSSETHLQFLQLPHEGADVHEQLAVLHEQVVRVRLRLQSRRRLARKLLLQERNVREGDLRKHKQNLSVFTLSTGQDCVRPATAAVAAQPPVCSTRVGDEL